MRIRLCPKNKPACSAGPLSPVLTIYAVYGKLQPPDCVPSKPTVPDILHGSYLLSEQSPASSHNTPFCRRSHRITKLPPDVKRKFCIFRRISAIIFVQCADLQFSFRRGLRNRLGGRPRPSSFVLRASRMRASAAGRIRTRRRNGAFSGAPAKARFRWGKAAQRNDAQFQGGSSRNRLKRSECSLRLRHPPDDMTEKCI